MISAKRVDEILSDCFLKKDELTEDGKPKVPFVKCAGVVRNFGLHPDRCMSHEDEIISMLDQVEDLDKGISFLCFGKCKDSSSEYDTWGEHRSYEALIALGISIGRIAYPFPRDMWGVLPGSVPYVMYSKDKKLELDIVYPE